MKKLLLGSALLAMPFTPAKANPILVDANNMPAVVAVPSPIAGAGILGIVAMCLGLVGLVRWRKPRE